MDKPNKRASVVDLSLVAIVTSVSFLSYLKV